MQSSFDQWQLSRACEHELGVLLYHHIGNIATVAAIRTELAREGAKFPLLLSKVLYNGTHGGDFLTVEEVKSLPQEVAALHGLQCNDPDLAESLQVFAAQMAELVDCSLRVRKPLAF